MFPNTCSAKGNLIVCPVNWLTKAVNFSGKILNKVHLYHNPCNILCNIFYTISLGTLKCVLRKEGIDWFLKFINILQRTLSRQSVPCTVPRTIWLMWSMFLNLWTVFTMEAIVLVSVLTSSAKKYDLGPLQDSYPARRRPSKFCYRNSVTKM